MRSQEFILAELKRLFDPESVNAFGPIFGPVSETKIEAAERQLATKFPSSYRLFLQNYGAAQFSSIDVLGISEPKEGSYDTFFDVVVQTLTWRNMMPAEDALPGDSIYVATDSGEVFFCLDMSQSSDEMAPVIARGGGIRPQKVAADFLDLLRKIATEAEPFPDLQR